MRRIGIITLILLTSIVLYSLDTTSVTQAAARQKANGGSPSLQVQTGPAVNAGEQVVVSVAYQGGGAGVASMSFSLDIDESCLAYASHAINAPNSFFANLFVDTGDSDGELDVVIASFNTLADQSALLAITFTTICQPGNGSQQNAAIEFANGVEFRNTSGQLVSGSATGSSVLILSAVTPTATTTSTPTPTATVVPATSTTTATPTNTTLPTATATATPANTTLPTATATATPNTTGVATATATPTATAAATATSTPTGSVTATATATMTDPQPTATATKTGTVEGTATATAATPSPTTTPTATNTLTAEATASPTITPTATPTLPPTATPTPQTIIASIALTRTATGVLLSWTTSQEIDSQGFYVFRTAFTSTIGVQQVAYLTEITDEFIPLTGLIPSKGSAGGAYTFLDETADPKITYAYLLVERKVDDTYIEYRQSLIVIGQEFENPYLFYLPLLVR